MMKKVKKTVKMVVKVFGGAAVVAAGAIAIGIFGYIHGYNSALQQVDSELKYARASWNDYLKEHLNQPKPTPETVVIEKPVVFEQKSVTWTGPALWEAVNKKRQEYGVSALSSKSELCTIASIRLNELLALGSLDGHEGFSNLPERRGDLKWIFEKYNLSEFLVSGAETAEEAVSLWDNTLGHKKLLTGGEYVWGCVYGQSGFGVAIAAY